jgi:antitoxin component of MazEF toxin-antitoxin module
MDIKIRRKLLNRVGDSRMVSIPPLLLENMDALDCEQVIISVLDRDHLLLEVVRKDAEQ